MKKQTAVLVGLPVLGALYFAFPKAGHDRFLITGSSTLAPVLQRVAEDLQAVDPELCIDVETGGSARGSADAREGVSDAGMASRDLSPEESRELSVHRIAHDGVAMIVHASNPLAAIEKDDVVRIYRGEVASWAELGSGTGEIKVVNKAEGRATLAVFLEHFGLKNSEIRAAAVIGDNAQGVRLVAGNPGAIAYISIGEALSARERGEPIRLLALDGVEPTKETIADGSYPLRRGLFLLLPAEPGEIDRRILGHLASERGREIIERCGFVPVEPTE
jgi:phosphate transport system substrate-binding protein